ncbi:MAG: hypothetical protein DME10_06170 [Candidatus Rokuibacteriota bacterium]|nr:MAG: hypothetical protein DME10_06170 [Candidatus Rokubacteria bacterium]
MLFEIDTSMIALLDVSDVSVTMALAARLVLPDGAGKVTMIDVPCVMGTAPAGTAQKIAARARIAVTVRLLVRILIVFS